MSSAQATKRREGELTGPRKAKCVVTILSGMPSKRWRSMALSRAGLPTAIIR